jgi:hypothetical protein
MPASLKAGVPDFAIIGAPKCGTTSIYSALSRHHEISMSHVKECHFFATDLPGMRQVVSQKVYNGLFRGCDTAVTCGEASVFYLYSKVAIPAMIKRNPNLRVIVLVRNPIDLFQSFHNELLKGLDEDQSDPEVAWALQADRGRCLMVPATCSEALLLKYREVCALGNQIQRLAAAVPSSQRLTMVFDDLINHPGQSIDRIHEFLGVSSQVESRFPNENGFGLLRSKLLASCLRMPYHTPWLNNARIKAKPIFHRLGLHPLASLFRLNTRRIGKPPLRAEFRAELALEFRDDISLLEETLGRSFAHWLADPLTTSAMDESSMSIRR